MRLSTVAWTLGSVLVVLGVGGSQRADSGPAAQSSAPPAAATAPDMARTPLILAAADGERRIRRVMGGALAIVKVDRRNGGSPNLMMGYEELPPRPGGSGSPASDHGRDHLRSSRNWHSGAR